MTNYPEKQDLLEQSTPNKYNVNAGLANQEREREQGHEGLKTVQMVKLNIPETAGNLNDPSRSSGSRVWLIFISSVDQRVLVAPDSSVLPGAPISHG
jgi:hypothetical protein